MGFYGVRTTKGREKIVADKIIDESQNIKAVLSPKNMSAYVIVETDDKPELERVAKNIPSANKVLEKQTSLQEVKHFLQPSSDVENLEEGYIVEVGAEAFKGQKAKITNINPTNEEVTVEMQNATVPIPVTLKGGEIRKVLSKDPEGEEV